MKEQKGITLIALVITIIVLLILAGVSIAMLTGQNGILTQASNADKQNLKAEAEEAVKLALNTIMTNKAAKDAGSTANETEAPTTATADNILAVIIKNNPNASSSTSGGQAAGVERTITYKASANSKSVVVTISAAGVVSAADPQ